MPFFLRNTERFDENIPGILPSIFFLLFLLFFPVGCKHELSNEPHVPKIIKHIQMTRSLIQKKLCAQRDCIFFTFWDFDGTILKGDITNGLPKKGGLVYTGLQRRAIEQGYSALYQDYNDYMDAYHRVEKKSGHAGAYRFLAAPFAGRSRRSLEAFSKREFEANIRPYLFASSMQIFRALQKENIRTYIISASADFFVSGTKDTLQVPKNYLHGFATESIGDRLTGRIVEPFNYAAGKTARIQMILTKVQKKHPKARLFVLAGFGNSHHTDGHFLRWISSQKLPAKKAIAVMINEKVPPNEQKYFWLVKQAATVSGK